VRAQQRAIGRRVTVPIINNAQLRKPSNASRGDASELLAANGTRFPHKNAGDTDVNSARARRAVRITTRRPEYRVTWSLRRAKSSKMKIHAGRASVEPSDHQALRPPFAPRHLAHDDRARARARVVVDRDRARSCDGERRVVGISSRGAGSKLRRARRPRPVLRPIAFSSRRRLRAALRAREIALERGIDRYSGINS